MSAAEARLLELGAPTSQDKRPPIVLIHGFSADRLSWTGIAPVLAKTHRVYAIELPGHGGTPPVTGSLNYARLANGVADAVRAQGLSAAHVIGHSLGGSVSLQLAAEHAELVLSLCMMAPAGYGKALNTGFLRGFTELTSEEDTLALLQLLVFNPRMISRQLVPGILAQLDKPGIRECLREIASTILNSAHEREQSRQVVMSSDLPQCLIWGRDDIINPMDADTCASWNLDLTILDACGHLPHVEKRVAVLERIQRHLAAVEEATLAGRSTSQ